MILEFKIQNFLSFKNEVTFSFEATKDKTHEDYYVTEVAPGVKILRFGIVYGANASGKSNLIKAFDFIREIARELPNDREKETGFIPFLFGNSAREPGHFELTFYIQAVKFIYSISVDKNIIYNEKLQYYPGTQPAVIFDRFYDKDKDVSVIEFGNKIKIPKSVKELITGYTLNNTSVIAATKQVNFTIPAMHNVREWFKKQFLPPVFPPGFGKGIGIIEYTNRNIKINDELKKFTIDFLKNAEYNITDILYKTENQEGSDEKIGKLEFEHIVNQKGEICKYKLAEQFQSAGALRYYGFSAPLYKLFNSNGFLPVDEIESSLHPILVNHLIRYFLVQSQQCKNVQFLATTHNISLLNEKDLLRKDAIWFTEKQEDGSTELYSMAEFDIRKELSYYNAYKTGKFGAVPFLK
ncbi:MAG: AAA family ATPase [bacterium]